MCLLESASSPGVVAYAIIAVPQFATARIPLIKMSLIRAVENSQGFPQIPGQGRHRIPIPEGTAKVPSEEKYALQRRTRLFQRGIATTFASSKEVRDSYLFYYDAESYTIEIHSSQNNKKQFNR